MIVQLVLVKILLVQVVVQVKLHVVVLEAIVEKVQFLLVKVTHKWSVVVFILILVLHPQVEHRDIVEMQYHLHQKVKIHVNLVAQLASA